MLEPSFMVLVISWLCFVVTKIGYNDLPNILLVPRSAAALVPWFLVVVYIDIILSSWKRLTTGCGDRKKADGHPAGTCASFCRNGDIQLESK